MKRIVQKFGGTSVADAHKIHRAARRAIRAKLEGYQVVMVVSAMGDTTDRLLDLARQVSRNPPRRELDVLLTTGEQVSIALMAMAIIDAGHEAISLTGGQVGLLTDEVHTRARIQRIHRDRIERELEAGRIVIVAGFQGTTPFGEITTLGRGASDTTAVALAAVLGAELCEIYTDVDGVYTSDPRIVPLARRIERISYDEMLELASLGAGVLHARAVEFGKKYGVPIHVRSAMTDSPGTMIVEESAGMEDVLVRGVTLKRNLARISLIGLRFAPDAAANIFTHLAERHIVVDDIIQNRDLQSDTLSLGITIETDDPAEIENLRRELAGRIDARRIEIEPQVAKVSVVGIGMRSHSGVAARVFRALADAGIPIENVSTSEIVISCIVRSEDGERALRALHDAFELHRAPGTDAPPAEP